jgi:hypothetical protein
LYENHLLFRTANLTRIQDEETVVFSTVLRDSSFPESRRVETATINAPPRLSS